MSCMKIIQSVSRVPLGTSMVLRNVKDNSNPKCTVNINLIQLRYKYLLNMKKVLMNLQYMNNQPDKLYNHLINQDCKFLQSKL